MESLGVRERVIHIMDNDSEIKREMMVGSRVSNRGYMMIMPPVRYMPNRDPMPYNL